MTRYFLRFSYIGTRYRGSQKHGISNHIRTSDTVQGALENGFLACLPQSLVILPLYISSRTDAGVHAFDATGHIELIRNDNTLYDPDYVLRFMNRYLLKCSHDIRLLEFQPVTNEFHSRHSALSRTYMYRFIVPKHSNENRVPISELNQSCHIRNHKFDIEKVKKSLELFKGRKNYMTLCALDRSKPNIRYERSLKLFTLKESHALIPTDPYTVNYNYWEIICSAKSFLYNQVRRMVASLIALGTGIITEKDLHIMLTVPSHNNWNQKIMVAPPHGLYLMKVEYDKNEFLNNCITSSPEIESTPLLRDSN